MRIRFTADHDLVTPIKTVSHKKDDETTVAKEVGEKLIADGKAAEVTESKKKADAD